MLPTPIKSTRRPLSQTQLLREAVLLLFCDPLPDQWTPLIHLSHVQWKQLLHWLDVSGLALYFLDRLKELNLLETLPVPVLARLEENLADNSKRIKAMVAESVAIQRRFLDAGLSFAVLKGFSLWPTSVPKFELRSQLDLDFLIAEAHAAEATRIIEEFGYRLGAISGKSLEFKANEDRISSLKDMYKAGMIRSAELHLETAESIQPSLLARTERQCFHGVNMPVLSPVDLFLGQGLHLYKHICSEFSRAAHLIEFRRHVIARQDDKTFWKDLRSQATARHEICQRLGIVVLLIERVMGPFAPEDLTCWTTDRLSDAARSWVDRYGHRTVLANFPGNKLYLLLQQELAATGVPIKRSLRQALLPLRLPPSITKAVKDETLPAKLKRHKRQLLFIGFRLRFHTLEGLRYLRELILWHQHRNGFSQ